MPIGPGDYLLTPPSRMILGFLNGETPAYLDCEFNIVDARDVAAGQILAAEKGRVGERYILGNVNLRLGDLLEKLHRLTGLPMPHGERRNRRGDAQASDGAADRCAPRAHLDGVRLQQGRYRARLVVPPA
jgi:dihydroflavonol-4-reductase